jgi:hypothetical protein
MPHPQAGGGKVTPSVAPAELADALSRVSLSIDAVLGA